MERRLFSEHLGLDRPDVDLIVSDDIKKEVTDQDRVIEMIFVPDHKTGLPSSDISMYLSVKTPPQVREFIKQNIFGDPKQPSNGWQDGLDDDTIADLVRQNDETIEMYSDRISKFMINERQKVQESFARVRNLERTKNSKKD